MKYILPIALLLFLTSCSSEVENTEDINDPVTQSQEEEVVTEKEAFVTTAEVVKNNKEFKLLKPDMEYFNQLKEFDNGWGYTYLKKYYLATSEKKGLSYDEWDSSYVCGFGQSFDHVIEYSMYGCGEGGTDRAITFPRTDHNEVKEFVETFFYDEYNTWTDNNTYAPDGAGCHYVISHKSDRTTIGYYCGC